MSRIILQNPSEPLGNPLVEHCKACRALQRAMAMQGTARKSFRILRKTFRIIRRSSCRALHGIAGYCMTLQDNSGHCKALQAIARKSFRVGNSFVISGNLQNNSLECFRILTTSFCKALQSIAGHCKHCKASQGTARKSFRI